MRLLRNFLLALLGLGSMAGFTAQAQTTATAPARDLVKLSHRLSVEQTRPGDTFLAAVILDIAPKWHVQAARPTFDYLVPTALELTPEPGIQLGPVSYPRPVQSMLGEDKIDVFEGQAPLLFRVTVASDVTPGARTLRGTLTYQPCDDDVCLAPTTVNIEIPFEVVAAGTPVTAQHADWFAKVEAANAPAVPAGSNDDITRAFAERGAIGAFLLIFLVGLALNLTPCVYPMLSVTVSIFGAQNDTSLARVFFKAVVYVLGIATMYSVLGTVTAFTGGLFGGLLQNRWVLLGIAALFVGLALSMFGLYELRPPSAMMSRLGGTSTAGLASIYVSGLVVGIFAAPCVGPPVIALLAVVAAKGDPLFGFLSFFTLSLGLGSPYLVLGTFSGLLKKLPRSGVWMEWIKKVFGVALLAVALFYLALGFLPGLVKWVPALALVLGGIYLGFITRTGNDRKTFRNVKWAVGAFLVAAGLFLFATEPRVTLAWESYDSGKLARAKAEGKPVILDFYADWCIPCHELERKTFSHPDVMEALKDHVRLKVDLTKFDSPESEALRQQFGIRGVPTVILLDRDGAEVPGSRVVGFLPAQAFLEQAKLNGVGSVSLSGG
jgi:thiol:disulfide interchange protein DsbD